MIKKTSWSKMILTLTLLSFTFCNLEVDQLMKRLENVNDDLEGFDTEVYNALRELSNGEVEEQEGLENAIAMFFTYNFSENLNKIDLEKEVNEYLSKIENFLKLSGEEH